MLKDVQFIITMMTVLIDVVVITCNLHVISIYAHSLKFTYTTQTS